MPLQTTRSSASSKCSRMEIVEHTCSKAVHASECHGAQQTACALMLASFLCTAPDHEYEHLGREAVHLSCMMEALPGLDAWLRWTCMHDGWHGLANQM